MFTIFQIKSAQLVDAYIDRVKHVNGALNAMVDENFTTAKNMALNIDNYLAIIDKNSEEYEKVRKCNGKIFEKTMKSNSADIPLQGQGSWRKLRLGLFLKEFLIQIFCSDFILIFPGLGGILPLSLLDTLLYLLNKNSISYRLKSIFFL